jgi:ribonuclease HII
VIVETSNYAYERSLAPEGAVIAGTDEAGAGPLAGPVVAAAVILPANEIEGVNDSKQLSDKRRTELFDEIKQKAVAFCIIEISPEEIDRINIYWACVKAMTLAVRGLAVQPTFVVSDARRLPDITIPQRAVVKGDALCASIGAASILAKVHRDRLLEQLDTVYPGYGFAKHKGYGTEEHLAAIKSLGPSPIHRMTFAPLSDKQLALPF